MAIFTKFDGLVTQEYGKLDDDIESDEDRWKKAEDNAKNTFQQLYDQIMNTRYPPKVHVQLRGGGDLQFLEQSKDNSWQIWTSLRRPVLSWLRRLQMQLMMSVSMSCLFLHRWTTLVSVLNLHLGENCAINAILNIDKPQRCLEIWCGS